MKIAVSKVYILIIIGLIILTRIYTEIQEMRSVTSGGEVYILYQFTQIKSECWYSTEQFYFQLPECHQITAGETYYIAGSIDAASDKGLFSRKRLIVKDKQLIESSNDSFNSWKVRQIEWKNQIWNRLSQPVYGNLPYPHSTVLLSMVFGGQAQVDDEIKDLFRLTGTSHLQAVSGYNFAIIASGIYRIVKKRLQKRTQGVCILVASLMFFYIIGVQPSVIRALATLITVLVIRFFMMYQYNTSFYLAFVLVFMLFWKPLWLFSISFQLSVTAVVGIVYIQPLLQHSFDTLVSRITQKPSRAVALPSFLIEIVSSLTTSVAAALTTAPLLLFHFHELSLIGIFISSLFASILNFLVTVGFWTTLTAAMIYNAITENFFIIWIKLFLYIPLEVFLSSMQAFSSITYLNFKIAVFPWWMVCIWYLGLFIVWKITRVVSNNSRERLFV